MSETKWQSPLTNYRGIVYHIATYDYEKYHVEIKDAIVTSACLDGFKQVVPANQAAMQAIDDYLDGGQFDDVQPASGCQMQVGEAPTRKVSKRKPKPKPAYTFDEAEDAALKRVTPEEGDW